MSRTQTKFVSLPRLQSTGKEASLIIRLMMACNYIALANECLSKFKEDQSPIRRHVQKGALMYFVRLQCGHIKEAMDIIEEVNKDSILSRRVERLTPLAQDCFQKLVNCLKGGPNHKDYKNYIMLVRHKTVFHYDEKLVEKALNDRASRPESAISKITRGDHISLWRFEVSDDIVDSIICRYIWKIPRSADLRREADRIADFGSNLCVSLLDFCGEFIFSYVEEKALI